jgi:hypothetical protein
MKKKLNVDHIQSELRGGSAFFPGYKKSDSPAQSPIEEARPEPETEGKLIVKDKMSTNPQTVKPTSQYPTLEHLEKVEKYTTHLEPSLVKRLKHFALEKDMKDYEVIKNALLLYLEQNK